MKEEQQDKLLIETHSDVKVIRKTLENHGTTLYGLDGNSGITKELTLLKERQDKCPARNASTAEGKQMKKSTVLLVVAIVTVLVDVVIGFFKG